MTGWTEDRIAILRRDWGNKLAANIADELGCSRNAVIGKAHRLGLPKIEMNFSHTKESRAKLSASQRQMWANRSRENRIEIRMALSRGQRERRRREAEFGR
jgi:hypothetical protein